MNSNQDRSNRGGSSKGSGGKEMEYPGMDLSPPGFPNGYKKFIWHGSRVYKYSNAPPHIVFKLGWRENDGYDDRERLREIGDRGKIHGP